MKQFEPIPVYPLNMRGRFGLTRHIYRHGFASAFFYTFFYALICVLLLALCLLPVCMRLFVGFSLPELFTKAQELFDSMFKSFSQGPTTFFWSWRSPNDFLPQSGAMLFGILGSIGLCILALGFFFFYLKPRYLGVMYNEMSARIYGSAGSLGELNHRGGSCLRRYYTTYLAQLVGKIGAGVVFSFLARALGFLLAGFAVIAAMFSVVGGGLAATLIMLLSAFLGYVGKTLLTLCYPVAVGEDKRDFSALGRGISLGWRNFGRIFSSLILRELYVCLWMLPGTILMSISVFSQTLRVPLMLAAFAWMGLVRLYFVPFRLAFDTVLYYDAVARELQSRPAETPSSAAAEAPEMANETQDESEAAQTDSSEDTVFVPTDESSDSADENSEEQNESKE